MMKLYSHMGEYPTPIPHRIILSNGESRTDPTTFTDEEIADAGYVEVTPPREFFKGEKLEWTGSEFIIRPFTQEEIGAWWQELRNIRDKLLSLVDKQVDRYFLEIQSGGSDLDISALDLYAKSLRDITTDFENPWDVVFNASPFDGSA